MNTLSVPKERQRYIISTHLWFSFFFLFKPDALVKLYAMTIKICKRMQ